MPKATMTKMEEAEGVQGVLLTNAEAECLYNHLELCILDEIRTTGEDYDNMGYLCNLVNIYQRCKAVTEKHGT